MYKCIFSRYHSMHAGEFAEINDIQRNQQLETNQMCNSAALDQ